MFDKLENKIHKLGNIIFREHINAVDETRSDALYESLECLTLTSICASFQS